MCLKRRWLYIVFTLALLPVAAHAQTSLYGLPANKLGVGFDIRGYSNSRLFIGNFGMGFRDGTLKFSVVGGLPTEDFGVPLPILGIEGVQLYSLESGFEIFSTVEYYIMFSDDLGFRPTTFVGGIGLSKYIETQTGSAKPFVGLLYQRTALIELIQGAVTIDGTETIDLGSGFGAQAGLEYRMAKFSITVLARSAFPLDSSKIGFKLGINFFL